MRFNWNLAEMRGSIHVMRLINQNYILHCPLHLKLDHDTHTSSQLKISFKKVINYWGRKRVLFNQPRKVFSSLFFVFVSPTETDKWLKQKEKWWEDSFVPIYSFIKETNAHREMRKSLSQYWLMIETERETVGTRYSLLSFTLSLHVERMV